MVGKTNRLIPPYDSARFAVALVFAIFSLAMSAEPQALAPDALTEAISQAQNIIQTNVAPLAPGLDVAVAVNGKIVWSQGFGYADLAAKTPVTSSTRFRIGSVSKPLTAAGLALLVERGQMDLDAPVQQYLPDFPQKEAPITIRLLAGHLSGIRNYRGNEAFSNQPYPDLRSALKIFENDPLLSPPGTKFSYSSYNWNVIGAAMESAAKENFLKYMTEQVFRPLNLTNTIPDLADVTDPQRTHFYEEDVAGNFIPAPQVDSSYKWPSGGFLSTAEDLANFGSAMLKPGFLKPQSLKLLFTSQKTLDGTPTKYGLGWFIGRTVLYHEGDAVGGTSVLFLHPSSHIVVAIIGNRGSFIFNRDIPYLFASRKTDLHIAEVTAALKIIKIFASLPVKS